MKTFSTIVLTFLSFTSVAQWNYDGQGIIYSANGNVGVGTSAPQEKLHINGAVRGSGTAGALRISTTGGWVDIGPTNGIYSHFNTNLDKFYFGKPVYIDGGLSSYNTLNLQLQTNGATRMTILNSDGNVGIGTTSPTTRLESEGAITINPTTASRNYLLFKNNGAHVGIIGSDASISGVNELNFGIYVYGNNNLEFWTNSARRLLVNGAGNIGIGVNEPAEKLHINGAIRGNGTAGALRISTAGGYVEIGPTNTIYSHFNTNLGKFYFNKPIYVDGGISSYNTLNLELQAGGNTRMTILNSNGNVGIGCTNPTSKLMVKGTIQSEEVKVELLTSVCPDYVFEPDYDLATLAEIETYIKENKHLPEVPSAKEMEDNGMNLKEMNLILLKKVEELTLHLIAQQKEIEELKQKLKGKLKR